MSTLRIKGLALCDEDGRHVRWTPLPEGWRVLDERGVEQLVAPSELAIVATRAWQRSKQNGRC